MNEDQSMNLDRDAQRAAYLLKGHLQQTLTGPEKDELDAWISASPENAALFEELNDEKKVDGYLEKLKQMNREKIRAKIVKDIRFKRAPAFNTWKYVAAAVLLLAVGIYTYWNASHQKPGPAPALVRNPIQPGGNKATLTLSDGSVIVLDSSAKGLVANQGGTVISKPVEGEINYEPAAATTATIWNTITTPNGGQYALTLADGTRIWLNAASSVRFPVQFVDSIRQVEITGEAYFEVAKSSKKFIAASNLSKVEVLGTHFNINAYPGEDNEIISLLEGKVKVNGTATLAPGEILFVPGKKNEKMEQLTGDTSEMAAWKNGYFNFNNTPLTSIMKEIARWYNSEVVYEGEPSSESFSGIISRNENITRILDIMQRTNKIKFRTEGRKIIVTKK